MPQAFSFKKTILFFKQNFDRILEKIIAMYSLNIPVKKIIKTLLFDIIQCVM